MTKSLTPAITITQTGGAQLVIITPGAGISTTPSVGNALAGQAQTVVIKP